MVNLADERLPRRQEGALMGGYAGDQKPKSLRPRALGQGRGDPCDIEIELDLVGLQPEVSRLLTPGEVLRVELVSMGTVTSVVCQTSHGHIVGALAAIRGLAQLITCLQRGIRYRAFVIIASASRCAVRVARVEG